MRNLFQKSKLEKCIFGKSFGNGIIRTMSSSYRKGPDFKMEENMTINDILVNACETHPDKTMSKPIVYSL